MGNDTTATAILEGRVCDRGSCVCRASARAGRGLTHCPAHDDPGPSLNVSPPKRTPNPLVRCFAGCSYDAIVAELRNGGLWPAVTMYRVGGAVHKRIDRVGGKDVSWNRGAKPRDLLYPDGALEGLTPGAVVLICEGEKATDAAISRGLAAVGSVCGSSATPSVEVLQPLSLFDVVLVPDNDEPGRAHMRAIASELSKTGGHPRWLTLPELPEKGDLADYAGTDEALAGLIAAAPHWESDEQPERKFKLISAAELKRREPPKFLINDILTEHGLHVLVSPPGVGKSFLALGMAASIASGTAWMDHPTRKGSVIYVAAEGVGGMGLRVDVWEEAHLYPDISGLHFITQPVQFMEDGDLDDLLISVMTLRENPALIVVDTMARCLVGADENSSRDVGQFIAGIDRIRQATGAAVLVVHHSGKAQGAVYRGSSALEGACDAMIALSGEPARLELECVKQKDAEPFKKMYLRLEPTFGSCVIVLSDGAFEGITPAMLRAFGALRENFGELGATATQWHKTVADAMPERSFYRVRKDLLDGGHVANVGTETRPRYVVTTETLGSNAQTQLPNTANAANSLPQIQMAANMAATDPDTAILPHPFRGGSVAAAVTAVNKCPVCKLGVNPSLTINGKCSSCAGIAS